MSRSQALESDQKNEIRNGRGRNMISPKVGQPFP